MFDSLKKKLKEGIKKLSNTEPSFEEEEQFLHEKTKSIEETLKKEPARIEREEEREEHFEEELPRKKSPELKKEKLKEREAPEERPSLEDKILKKEETLEKKGFLKKISSKVIQKQLSAEDIDNFFDESQDSLLEANVALEVIDFFRDSIKKQLISQAVRRGSTETFLKDAFQTALLQIVDQGSIDLIARVRAQKPFTILFLGFNGAGKTTTIAKVAHYLQAQKFSCVLAAGDTFRAASIEQLEHHARVLGARVIKHTYGADAAAVIFDAKKHATAQGLDIVLADTAGRTHVDKNLLDELKKVVRVNKPDLKVLVLDSLTGNDAVEQARLYHEAVGVDAVVLTKLDVNKKGGSLLSVCYAIKKPILFLGTGQKYENLEVFQPRAFVDELLA